MKRAFVLCTLMFWLAVGLMSPWGGGTKTAVPPTVPQRATQAAPPAADASVGDRTVSLEDLARHAIPTDCWMAIEGQVYDLSAYLPKHPSEPALIEPWCGRDATEGWTTKGLGRAHSARAAAMLPRYRIGRLG